jgi:hypothetical protein
VRVHPCPASGADVPDDREARLVILDPEYPHSARTPDSDARKQAQVILDQRGQSPRLYRNALVFLAPDKTRLGELDEAVRQYLAWKSIYEEREPLNLDVFQTNQARTKTKDAEDTIRRRIPETYQWLLVPTQPDPQRPIEWEEYRLQGDDALAVRASKKLKNEMLLLTEYAPTLLRSQLDAIPLWRADHVGVKQLCEDFAQYLYLPRLQDSKVLIAAISNGLSLLTWEQETFAYAEGWDEKKELYRGLRAGSAGLVTLDNSSLVVKPEAATRQQRAQTPSPQPPSPPLPEDEVTPGGSGGVGVTGPKRDGASAAPQPPAAAKAKRFHGVVRLDATRMGRDAGSIAEAVVQHIAGLVDANVEITLEIHAEIPEGTPDNVVRTVTENCRTLRFSDFGFEDA